MQIKISNYNFYLLEFQDLFSNYKIELIEKLENSLDIDKLKRSKEFLTENYSKLQKLIRDQKNIEKSNNFINLFTLLPK